MIIVSQDKTEIVNFEKILSIKMYHDEEDIKFLYELYCCVNAPGDNYILIGIYKTEERAKEVLHELINRIVLTERFEALCIPEQQNNMVIDMYDNDRPLFIYEMPKE